jgi:hypothetical protein
MSSRGLIHTIVGVKVFLRLTNEFSHPAQYRRTSSPILNPSSLFIDPDYTLSIYASIPT